MFWPIVGLSVVGCIGMAVMDTVGTILVRAINAGRGNLAGMMDAIGDLAKMSVLSIAAVRLTTHYGWWGWLGIIPILITGFLVTRHATHLTSGIEDEEEAAEDDERDSKMLWLEREFLVLKAEHERRRDDGADR